MAQIGREYGCTAPAIRYIIKRSGLLKNGQGDESAAAGAGLPQPHERTAALAAAESRASSTRLQAAAPVMATSSRPSARDHVLGPELRQRVSGDVASFLVALDQAVLEDSLESAANLQEATDRLMRSAARTRLELEQLLNRRKTAEMWEKSGKKAGSPQRRAKAMPAVPARRPGG